MKIVLFRFPLSYQLTEVNQLMEDKFVPMEEIHSSPVFSLWIFGIFVLGPMARGAISPHSIHAAMDTCRQNSVYIVNKLKEREREGIRYQYLLQVIVPMT